VQSEGLKTAIIIENKIFNNPNVTKNLIPYWDFDATIIFNEPIIITWEYLFGHNNMLNDYGSDFKF